MALSKVKTEMTGTGGGRWTTREDAKKSGKKRRRRADKEAVVDRAPPGYTKAPKGYMGGF